MTLPTFLIHNFQQQQYQDIHRVSAIVADELIWFEANVPLIASPEAFACVMLSPSQELGSQLRIDGEVDTLWYQNIKQLMAIFAQTHNFSYIEPQVNGFNNSYGLTTGHAGLCFSGGVDSFFTLLHYPCKIQKLIAVHGFDIPLYDIQRAQFLTDTAQKVAAVLGLELIIIRTNLRLHPLVAKQRWEIAYNGALAALGFLLNNQLDQLIVSSDGSRAQLKDKFLDIFWKIDQLWSSQGLDVIYYGDYDRLEKIHYIADNYYVQNYLRVCWKNHKEYINCSTCIKCVCTRICLSMVGKLDQYSLLNNNESLAQDIAALPALDTQQYFIHLRILKIAATCKQLSSSVRVAVNQLINLSTATQQCQG